VLIKHANKFAQALNEESTDHRTKKKADSSNKESKSIE